MHDGPKQLLRGNLGLVRHLVLHLGLDDRVLPAGAAFAAAAAAIAVSAAAAAADPTTVSAAAAAATAAVAASPSERGSGVLGRLQLPAGYLLQRFLRSFRCLLPRWLRGVTYRVRLRRGWLQRQSLLHHVGRLAAAAPALAAAATPAAAAAAIHPTRR